MVPFPPSCRSVSAANRFRAELGFKKDGEAWLLRPFLLSEPQWAAPCFIRADLFGGLGRGCFGRCARFRCGLCDGRGELLGREAAR